MIKNPFPGLRPFETDEDHLFFGRDDQSDEILKRLRCNRFVAVVGTSGSGKSSLIKAGLLPSLHGGFMVKAGSRWRIAVFRPGDRPIHNMAVALSTPGVLGDGSESSATNLITVETTLRRSGLGLIETVRQARMPAQENLLIVVDQFEELFRFKSNQETEALERRAAAFVKLLIEAAKCDEVPIYIVITMRSDFLGHCARFRELPDLINEGLYLIPLMSRVQHREAIEGPVAVAGAHISPALVNRLLNDIGEDPEQLPIMQHALMRTWEHWANNHDEGQPLDLRQYEAVGSMAEALSLHADEAYNELSKEHQELAQTIFRVLTEKRPGNPGVRRPTRVAELCAITEANEADVITVVENFRRSGRSFLMPPPQVELNADSLIDISHESLISGWKRLRGWVENEALSAAIYRRVADTAELYYRNEAGLWRDPDLKVALGWQEKARPNKAWGEHYHSGFEAAINFLKESKQAVEDRLAEREKQRRRALRRTRVTATALFVLALATTTFGFVAWKKSRYATDQATLAEKQKGVAQRAEKEAQDAKTDAERRRLDAEIARTDAENARQIAQEKAAEAQRNLVAANAARQVAEAAERNALEQAGRADQIALRLRKEIVSNSTILFEATERLKDASPSVEQNFYFRQIRAIARSQQRDHKGAIEESSQALEIAPEDPYVRGLRGYEQLLDSNSQEAIQDFEAYLKNDPHDANQYLNLSLAFGMLGQHSESLAAVNQAIDNFAHIGDEWFDSELSEDLTEVTHLPLLYADGDAFKTALKYQRAARLAISGSSQKDFATILANADEEARKNRRPLDAYFAALNWVWLQQRDRVEKDYGGLVIQGALWQRAAACKPELAKLAKRDYANFLRQHRIRHDQRYDDLANWVTTEIARFTKRQFPTQTQNPKALKLSIAAEEALATDNPDAIEILDEVIKLEPKNVDLRLKRLRANFEAEGITEELVNESKEILKLDPKAAFARAIIDKAKSDADPIWKFKRMVEYFPNDSNVLEQLTDALIEANRADEALPYLRRLTNWGGTSAKVFHQKAQILAQSANEKDLVEAELAINKAIALKPDEPKFYDSQEKIQLKLKKFAGSVGIDANLLQQRAVGYNTAADAMLKRGSVVPAFETYLKSLRILTAVPNAQRSVDMRWEMTVTLHKVARLVRQHESKAKAIELMEHLKGEFGDSEDLRVLLDNEINRLSNSPD